MISRLDDSGSSRCAPSNSTGISILATSRAVASVRIGFDNSVTGVFVLRVELEDRIEIWDIQDVLHSCS